MFNIAIVEDQEETRESLNRFVRQYAQEQGLQVEISLITDGAEIAEHYTPGFDIIFMDVEMPRLDGFGAAEAIRAVDADVVLVFVTNMAQYAIRGYEVDALDYVLKPVNYYQFCTKLSRAIQRVQRRRGGQVVLQLARRENYTVRQLYEYLAGARGHWVVVGTPQTIADRMQEWFENEAADGFNILPPWLPTGLEDFVDLVIPDAARRAYWAKRYCPPLADHRCGPELRDAGGNDPESPGSVGAPEGIQESL